MITFSYKNFEQKLHNNNLQIETKPKNVIEKKKKKSRMQMTRKHTHVVKRQQTLPKSKPHDKGVTNV